jgi:hypothetical protein
MSSFEMISSTRRALRRTVELPCDLLSSRAGVSREHMLDLSTRGACVTSTAALAYQDELLVAFTPPGMRTSIEAIARVAHVARPSILGLESVGVDVLGLEFAGLPASASRDIERALRGLPPPLPSLRRRIELAWIDVEMSWEEDLDDQLNVFATSERITMVDDGSELIEVAAPAAAMRLPVHIRTV